jgi:methionine-rich copper-binding protein CopC
MVVRSLRIFALVFLYSVSPQSHAQSVAMRSTSPIRLESVTINERTTELLVRFDRPISHSLSSLTLVRDGQVVATPHPRLEAAPNVLFARIPTPSAGNYTVRWTVCPEGTNDRYDGEFAFTIDNETASTADHSLKERQ